MSQKEMRKAKDIVTQSLEELAPTGFTFIGFGTEGAIFQSGEQYVVVKAVAKKEGYDPEEDIRTQMEKEEKAAEREEKRRAKAKKAKEKKGE